MYHDALSCQRENGAFVWFLFTTPPGHREITERDVTRKYLGFWQGLKAVLLNWFTAGPLNGVIFSLRVSVDERWLTVQVI